MIVIFNRDNTLLACITLSFRSGNTVTVNTEYFGAKSELLDHVLLAYEQQHSVVEEHYLAKYIDDLIIALRGATLPASLAPDEARMTLVRLHDPTYTAEIRAQLIGDIMNMSPKHLTELNKDLAFN